MASAYIINRLLTQSDRKRIEQTLRSCTFVPVHQIPPNLAIVDRSIDVGIVCLPVNSSEQKFVDEKVEEFGSAGIRVIGIWLREADEQGLGGIGLFGSGAVSIDSPSLVEVLCGEPVWTDPSGAAREPQKGPRNKC